MSTVLERLPNLATRGELTDLREDCIQQTDAQTLLIRNNHSELMSAVKVHYPGQETRDYIRQETKSKEQEMQKAATVAPLWRQVFDFIKGNKPAAFVCLVLSGFLVRQMIQFLEQILILINNATAHIWHP